jgi:hypothetical protein
MDSDIFYKGILPNWDAKNSYLILNKLICKTSYGKEFIRFVVVKRWSRQGWGDEGIFTDSLKGVEYTENEIILI